MSASTVDFNFVEDRESDSVFLDKLFDFCVCSRLLLAKLVARETQNREPSLSILCLKLLELSVVHVR